MTTAYKLSTGDLTAASKLSTGDLTLHTGAPAVERSSQGRGDMERHLNKIRYGCPADRFSAGSGLSRIFESHEKGDGDRCDLAAMA